MAIPAHKYPPKGHGAPLRGLDATVRSTLFQGRFGRMFRFQPADFYEPDLVKLAQAMTASAEDKFTSETENDDEENFGIPAGYTYFGQFIDHDISFDPMPLRMKENDPDGLVDFRTPALDLDNLYGRGPDDQPYMFEPNGRKFRLGDRFLTGGEDSTNLTVDLPRFHERAIIGDKRNDENVIVSQLQGLFLRFHNYLADVHPTESFGHLQQRVRWHYQWLVVFDFLPRMVGQKMVNEILPHLHSHKSIHDDKPKLNFFKWKELPFMPVEFSVAAYRFGHSMVRPIYRLSALDLPNTAQTPGLKGRKVVFDKSPNEGLNGFRAFPSPWGIDWSLFFETSTNKLSPANTGPGRVQPSYKIDTSLVSPLAKLPEFSKPGTDEPIDEPGSNPPRPEVSMLALRNLMRGNKLCLPSGQSVARQMGIPVIPDAELFVGKANVGGLADNKSIATHPDLAAFKGKAPLWFYILAEAQHQWINEAKKMLGDDAKNTTPVHLGPVGGRIVAEVLIGLLVGDPGSFLNADSLFIPEFGNPAAVSVFDKFTMGDLSELLAKHVPARL